MKIKRKSRFAISRMGSGNPMFGRKNQYKNGKSKRKDGYIYCFSPDHPHCHPNGYVLEHRIVMEKHIGRYLLPSEVVHHINNNPSDNRIENLVLFSSLSEHIKSHHKVGLRSSKNGKNRN